MSDADERSVLRRVVADGRAAEVARELLALTISTAEPGYWLLVVARRDEGEFSLLNDGLPWPDPPVKATGVLGDVYGGERWEALHAFAVFTLEDWLGLARHPLLTGRGTTLWDRKNGVRGNASGTAYLRVEDGWREPRERGMGAFGTERGTPNFAGGLPVRPFLSGAALATAMANLRSGGNNVLPYEAGVGSVMLTIGEQQSGRLIGSPLRGVTAEARGAWIPVYADESGALTTDPGTGRALVGHADTVRRDDAGDFLADVTVRRETPPDGVPMSSTNDGYGTPRLGVSSANLRRQFSTIYTETMDRLGAPVPAEVRALAGSGMFDGRNVGSGTMHPVVEPWRAPEEPDSKKKRAREKTRENVRRRPPRKL